MVKNIFHKNGACARCGAEICIAADMNFTSRDGFYRGPLKSNNRVRAVTAGTFRESR